MLSKQLIGDPLLVSMIDIHKLDDNENVRKELADKERIDHLVS